MVLPSISSRESNLTASAEEDFHLIELIAAGNENAFGEIYQRYNRPIYNYLLRILQDGAGADDVLQEVFIAVWQGAGRFRQNAMVKTWIYRIAYKQSMSWLRKHHQQSSHIELDEIEDESKSPEDSAMDAIRNTQLKKAIATLTPRHRAVLELAFIHDMSYGEISQILDCPIGTVKSRMSYAQRYLSHILFRIGIDHGENTAKESK
jgi:RNA polymerase sigma-70 factor (ECF subfamily)